MPPQLQSLVAGQPLPDGLEIVVLGNTNKPGNFILRPGIDDRPIGGIDAPCKSVSIATDLDITNEYQKMFGANRAMVRGDTLSGAFTEDIRAAGFDVLYAPTERNPFHARIVGVDSTFDEAGRDYLSPAFDRLARQKSWKPWDTRNIMSLDEVKSLTQLLKFLESWTSVNGDEYVYDASGMLALLGACLTNLSKFSLDADFEDLGEVFDNKQIEVLRKLLNHVEAR